MVSILCTCRIHIRHTVYISIYIRNTYKADRYIIPNAFSQLGRHYLYMMPEETNLHRQIRVVFIKDVS